MIRYVFNGKKYNCEFSLRQAVYKDDGIAFGALTPEVMKELGVSEEQYNPEDEMSDAELASRRRTERDMKLRATDVYLLPDFPDVTPEALQSIKAYRQALRDVPEQEGFPRRITWPEVPVFMKAKEKGNA